MRFLVVGVLIALPLVTPVAQSPSGVEQLAWMAGCWRQESGGRIADEIWMAPSGGVMLGMNRTVASGRTVSSEFMQIGANGGRIVFTARPSGQAEASFTLLKSGQRDVVFENTAHDFPQRVMYRRDGDTLVGRIEGTRNGKSQSIDYPMRRVPCAQ
jgi:hypothetical protein